MFLCNTSFSSSSSFIFCCLRQQFIQGVILPDVFIAAPCFIWNRRPGTHYLDLVFICRNMHHSLACRGCSEFCLWHIILSGAGSMGNETWVNLFPFQTISQTHNKETQTWTIHSKSKTFLQKKQCNNTTCCVIYITNCGHGPPPRKKKEFSSK